MPALSVDKRKILSFSMAEAQGIGGKVDGDSDGDERPPRFSVESELEPDQQLNMRLIRKCYESKWVKGDRCVASASCCHIVAPARSPHTCTPVWTSYWRQKCCVWISSAFQRLTTSRCSPMSPTCTSNMCAMLRTACCCVCAGSTHSGVVPLPRIASES